MTDEDSTFDVLGVLSDPVRRRLYRHVAAAPEEVSRDAAAEAAGVSRSLAAFHLDKLVEAGLLVVSFRRLSGRSGPGAGRPAKVYRRAEGEHAVSVPPRSYDAAARLLAEVLENAGLDRELQAAAKAAGAAQPGAGDVEAALRARGYEPFRDGETLRLRNCPFHALASEFPALICGMNLALIEGLAPEEWSPAMDPCPGGCCVSLSKNKTD
ncbi:helix-turn-helix domain-containing protein [Streptomyces sp. JB150]|uniref:helix-turn-helix transcriptional regulator n=1 Tax=Streptomyces sp. JB150 TaxID=2714844 RepID=UPI00140A53C3|nr:helix-turn-helix domain-containing protein [Streptomyces sp. JB150]QIJ60752.1 helix-turn-helix domain-containing protein [Streptomyces sp. JB150]